MANNKFWRRREPLQKKKSCNCGGEARLKSRTNYPFGKKSKSLLIMLYTCNKCGKLEMFNSGKGGGNNGKKK